MGEYILKTKSITVSAYQISHQVVSFVVGTRLGGLIVLQPALFRGFPSLHKSVYFDENEMRKITKTIRKEKLKLLGTQFSLSLGISSTLGMPWKKTTFCSMMSVTSEWTNLKDTSVSLFDGSPEKEWILLEKDNANALRLVKLKLVWNRSLWTMMEMVSPRREVKIIGRGRMKAHIWVPQIFASAVWLKWMDIIIMN